MDINVRSLLSDDNNTGLNEFENKKIYYVVSA